MSEKMKTIKEMQKRKRHEMVGFLFSHIRPQKQFISPNTQTLLIGNFYDY